MSTRARDFLHYGGGFLIDRLQRVGPGEPNRQLERTYEVGNKLSTGQTRDTPRLTFDGESNDASTEIEALLLGLDPTTVSAGQELKLTDAKPLDIVSPWKQGDGYMVNNGAIIPQLGLESMTYRFGVRQTATQAFTMSGDAIYYVTEGIPRYEVFPAAGVGPYNFANTPAVVTRELGDQLYAYSVCVVEADGTYTRLFFGEDYTNTTTGFTLAVAAPAGSELHVTYASGDGPVEFGQLIHPTATVKPAGLRAKDIELYVSDGAATPELVLWHGVQSLDFNWRVTRDPDEELGNPHYTSNDYDTPEVNGTVVVRAQHVEDLMERIAQVLGVPVGETANALADQPLEMAAVLHHPDTGVALKTLWTPDARFNPPGYQPQANQKMDTTFTWSSDSGDMSVFAGAMP